MTSPFVWLAILYGIPLVRLLQAPCGPRRHGTWLRRCNLWMGRYEWCVHPFRDTLLCGIWIALLLYDGYVWYRIAVGEREEALPAHGWEVALYAGLAGLSCWVWCDIRRHRIRLLDYARRAPCMHPREYFHAFFAGHGPIPAQLPDHPPQLQLPAIDFRRGTPARRRCWPVFHAVCTTTFMASQVLLARRRFGPDASPAIFDGLMQIWGARVLWLSRCRVTVEGAERLAHVRGQCLLCFTHKSALDFAVAPAALGLVPLAHRGPLRIRFLVAKDHFLDNWFLYRGIALGRAIEAAGMIFVNRRGTPEERRRAIPDAVDQLVTSGVDLAIFPQGTRVPGNTGRDGERADAGYFTAGGAARLQKEGGHLKKGAAYLALTSARRLAIEAGQPAYTVVPIALIGTATALPKGSVRLQTGTDIRLIIGQPFSVLTPGHDEQRTTNDEQRITTLHHTIDLQLEALLGLRSALATRFLTDIHRFLPADDVEAVAAALRKCGDADRIVYAILDGLYANRPHTWPSWQRALAQALHESEPREVLETLYQQVMQGL